MRAGEYPLIFMGRTRTRPPGYLRQVGRRLRLVRLVLGLSAVVMSRALGVSDKAYYQWEDGSRLFDFLAAIRLKELYGVPLDWIFDSDEVRLPERFADQVRGSVRKALADKD